MNSSSASLDIPCILWNLKVHQCVNYSSPLIPVLSQMNPVCTFPFVFRSSKLSSVTKFFYCLHEEISHKLLRFGLYIYIIYLTLIINFTTSFTSLIHINAKIECSELCVHIYDSLEYCLNESMFQVGVNQYSQHSLKSLIHHVGLYVCLMQITVYCCTGYHFQVCYLRTLSRAEIVWHWSKANHIVCDLKILW